MPTHVASVAVHPLELIEGTVHVPETDVKTPLTAAYPAQLREPAILTRTLPDTGCTCLLGDPFSPVDELVVIGVGLFATVYAGICMDAIPNVVERHIAEKPGNPVWTGFSAFSLYIV